jgi:hypothetical protein
MLSLKGAFPVLPEADGSYFIDRDGTHFRYILNYLRDGDKAELPNFFHEIQCGTGKPSGLKAAGAFREMCAEARHYRLPGLVELLADPVQLSLSIGRRVNVSGPPLHVFLGHSPMETLPNSYENPLKVWADYNFK